MALLHLAWEATQSFSESEATVASEAVAHGTAGRHCTTMHHSSQVLLDHGQHVESCRVLSA